jgi:AraC family transcriptional regulator
MTRASAARHNGPGTIISGPPGRGRGFAVTSAAVNASERNRIEYERRVNRVLDYIRAHRGEELSLEQLAAVASFSPFHFHRVFKSIVGENLREHIQRTRLEYAANELVTRPHVDILEVALENGFQSASAFARAFKERFGTTASEWRRGCRPADRNHGQPDSKPGIAEGKGGKASASGDRQDAFESGGNAQNTKENIMDVKVDTLPSYKVAYMRHIGPYGGNEISSIWHRLARWAEARDLWTADRICLGIPHDNPRVTEPSKCRYDAAVVVPEGFEADSDVNVVEVQGGKYAVTRFVGKAWEVGQAYDAVFAQWLPRSGYQPDDRLMFERYRANPYDEATGNFTCDVCAPVRPL